MGDAEKMEHDTWGRLTQWIMLALVVTAVVVVITAIRSCLTDRVRSGEDGGVVEMEPEQ